MTIDPYSLCPGGSGKKIKFCCGDLLDDLNRLDKMVEGEQYSAAVERIDTLLQNHAGNESLLALKTRLLRALGRMEEASLAADVFLEHHADNPVALAEAAILAASRGDGRGGMAKLQQALAVSGKEIYGRVYEAIGAVAAALLHEGEVCACRALLQLQIMIAKENREPLQMLVQINGAASIPLLLKQDQPLVSCPADAAWRPRFEEALAEVQRGRWLDMAERLAALADEHSQEPSILRNLATVRNWLADADGCVEALRKLAALDISRDDAVEAEALALLRSEDGFGDQYDVVELEYEVDDVDRLAAAFSTCKQAQQVPVDYQNVEENDVPPKSVFVLVDRPAGDSADQLDFENISQVIGQAMLFGRQTDRAARLIVSGVASRNVDELKAMLDKIADGQLRGQPRQKTLGASSAMQDLLRRPWYLPRDVTQAQLRELMQKHTQHALLEQWPQLSLGCLQGKTPRQAADESALANRVLALILILETTIDSGNGDFDFNRLRTELNLPQAETIDPLSTGPNSQGEAGQLIMSLPLVRLARVDVAKLSDELLISGFVRAAAFRADRAMRRFGEEILQRPALRGKDEENDVLRHLCSLETDVDKRLDYIKRGRDNAVAAGKSCAMWDLLELPVRLEGNDPHEIGRLIDHLQSRHINEPGVADTLVQFLVQIGAIRPDGTPAGPDAAQQATAAAPAEAAPGKLWTPGGQSTEGDKPSLWTPGMD